MLQIASVSRISDSGCPRETHSANLSPGTTYPTCTQAGEVRTHSWRARSSHNNSHHCSPCIFSVTLVLYLFRKVNRDHAQLSVLMLFATIPGGLHVRVGIVRTFRRRSRPLLTLSNLKRESYSSAYSHVCSIVARDSILEVNDSHCLLRFVPRRGVCFPERNKGKGELYGSPIGRRLPTLVFGMQSF